MSQPKNERTSATMQSEQPAATPESSSRPRGVKRKRNPQHARPNVYAAVAGHVSSRPTNPTPLFSASRKPLMPADVLFERLGAPDRYAEPQLDWYGAERWLDARTTFREDVYTPSSGESRANMIRWPHGEDPGSMHCRVPRVALRAASELASQAIERQRAGLPDSDLCKAIHRYTSAFFTLLDESVKGDNVKEADADVGERERRRRADDKRSFGSFDETALLAFAILLEESAGSFVQKDSSADGEGWRALAAGLDERGREAPRYRLSRRLKASRTTAKIGLSEEGEGSRSVSPDLYQSPARLPEAHSEIERPERPDKDRSASSRSPERNAWKVAFDSNDY